MASTFRQLTNYILLLPVFINSFLLSKENTGLPLDIHWFYPVMLLFVVICIIQFRSFKIPRYYYSVLLVLLIGVLLGFRTSLLNSIKQVLLIVINLIYYYYVIKTIGIKRSIRLYFNLSFVICLIGLIQVLICLSDNCDLWQKLFFFLTFHGLDIRLTSIESEPSYLAFSLMPAFAYIVVKNQMRTFKGAIIFLSYLLLNSLVAYVGVFMVFLYKLYKNPRNKRTIFTKVTGVLGICLILIIGANSSYILLRINDIFLVINSGEWKFSGINQSVYAILTNIFVVYESIKDSLLGAGLGNHVLNYDKYIPSNLLDDVNKEEAASLGLRVASEYGIILFIYFLFRVYNEFKRSSKLIVLKPHDNTLFFSYTLWFVLFLRIIRQGHYTMNGFIFFLTIYLYYNYNEKIYN